MKKLLLAPLIAFLLLNAGCASKEDDPSVANIKSRILGRWHYVTQEIKYLPVTVYRPNVSNPMKVGYLDLNFTKDSIQYFLNGVPNGVNSYTISDSILTVSTGTASRANKIILLNSSQLTTKYSVKVNGNDPFTQTLESGYIR